MFSYYISCYLVCKKVQEKCVIIHGRNSDNYENIWHVLKARF